MPPFLENGMHAVVLEMVNIFICHYDYQSASKIHDEISCFLSFDVPELFDDPFPKQV